MWFDHMLRQLAIRLYWLPHRPSVVADEGVRNIFSRLGLTFKTTTKTYSKLMGLENSNEALSAGAHPCTVDATPLITLL